jgi:hypothetical protein
MSYDLWLLKILISVPIYKKKFVQEFRIVTWNFLS